MKKALMRREPGLNGLLRGHLLAVEVLRNLPGNQPQRRLAKRRRA